MKRIAKFEKVSFAQFLKDMASFNYSEEEVKLIYDNINLPKRSTRGSAGYDFYIPFDAKLALNEALVIPTGIRVNITESWFLSVFPRSSMGFKYHMRLANTVRIIDSDYYNALNEGHIMIKIINGDVRELVLNKNDRFAQGIFTEFGITVDDEESSERFGGIGSTN